VRSSGVTPHYCGDGEVFPDRKKGTNTQSAEGKTERKRGRERERERKTKCEHLFRAFEI
jgi:hypothetical protein